MRRTLSEKDKARIKKAAAKGKKLAKVYVNQKGVQRVCRAHHEIVRGV